MMYRQFTPQTNELILTQLPAQKSIFFFVKMKKACQLPIWMRRSVESLNFRNILSVICLIFYSILTNAQTFHWAKNMGGSSADEAHSVAVDDSGNVYVTGYFSSSTAEFDIGGSGGGTLTTAGGNDVFLAKYDAGGNYLWAKNMGGRSDDYGYSVAVDGSGNVYVTGQFSSDTADFNTGGSGGTLTTTGGNDVFLAKYDAGGNYLWAKNMGGRGYDCGNSVAVDNDGNVYVTGYFSSDTADFNAGGSGGTLTTAGGNDVFLAKYDAGGGFLWAKSMGGFNTDESYSVFVDGSGNVYVTGHFGSTFGGASADFNPGDTGGILATVASFDAFLAKYDSGGNYLWAKSMGGHSDDYGKGVAVDGNGNVFVTGYFYSDTANFNAGGSGGTLTTAGGYDVFLAKYDAGGNYLWAKSMGGSFSFGTDFGQGVAVDGSGNVYVTGYFNSASADFNPGDSGGILTPVFIDAFIAKYNAGGNYLWAKNLGGGGDDFGYGVTVDGSGNVYVTGMFGAFFGSATADFNPGGSGGTLTAEGGFDGFVVKFSCNDTSSSYFAVTECGESYTLNEEVYTTSGIYTQHFPNTSGCDSIVTLDLTFIQFEPVISIDTFVLGVVGSYATYQWIKNGTDIPGATDSTYTVTENADYQVRVTDENGCEKTSAIYTINNVAINDAGEAYKQISVYPNPSQDLIYINTSISVNVVFTTLDGRSVKNTANATHISVKDLPEGMYFLRILDKENNLIKVEKVVVGN